MHGEATLVAAWDEAYGQPAWRRPLVLAAALTEIAEAPGSDAAAEGAGAARPTADELAHRPLGEVAARLVVLGRWLGGRFDAVATCGACGERVEAELPLAELARATDLPDPEPFSLEVDGWTVVARLPTPADLATSAGTGDPERAEQVLLDRCVLAATRTPRPAGTSDRLPAGVVDAVAAAMEERDPLGVLRASLVCQECGAAGDYLVDLAAWCWDEIDAYVQGLLVDVHRLASAYGWTEHDVLSLGPARRAFYLELVP